MTRVNADSDASFVLHQVNDTTQLREITSNRVTLATHVLQNCVWEIIKYIVNKCDNSAMFNKNINDIQVS